MSKKKFEISFNLKTTNESVQTVCHSRWVSDYQRSYAKLGWPSYASLSGRFFGLLGMPLLSLGNVLWNFFQCWKTTNCFDLLCSTADFLFSHSLNSRRNAGRSTKWRCRSTRRSRHRSDQLSSLASLTFASSLKNLIVQLSNLY